MLGIIELHFEERIRLLIYNSTRSRNQIIPCQYNLLLSRYRVITIIGERVKGKGKGKREGEPLLTLSPLLPLCPFPSVLPTRFAIAAAIVAATAATIPVAAEAPAISAKAATATAAILTWFGFVHLQRAPTDFLAIELLNSGSRFFLAGHFDEREAARTTGHAVFDNAR